MLIALPLAPLVVEGGALIALGFVGSAVYIAEELWGFRRAELPPLTGAEKETTHKEMVADVLAGAKIPVASLPSPQPFQFGPVWLGSSMGKAIDWGTNNTPAPSNIGEATLAVVNSNSSPAHLYYEVEWEQWASVDTLPNIYIDPSIDNAAGYGYYAPAGPINHSDQIYNLQPGASPLSTSWISDYEEQGEVSKWGEIVFGFPGAAGTAVPIWITNDNAEIQTVILYGDQNFSFEFVQPEATPKPNRIAPQSFKEDEPPKRVAPPLPYLPASVPDIGTPVTPGPARTPSDPTKKEDPKAPPDLTPAKVPIWAPGPNPSRAPSPAGTPQPGRNPQTIPSSDPARPNVAFDVAGLPIPQVAPAVKPTSTTAHQVGSFTIPAKAPQPTLQGIAEEVGRIEQKLELVLTLGNKSGDTDWMEKFREALNYLFSIGGGGDYELSSPCELDANGQRIVKKAHYNGSLFPLGIMENKIDALAELMQHAKDLKQPNCNPPKVAPSTVTVTAYEVPPYS